MASSSTRFLDHTQRRATFGKISLDELYLIILKQTFTPPPFHFRSTYVYFHLFNKSVLLYFKEQWHVNDTHQHATCPSKIFVQQSRMWNMTISRKVFFFNNFRIATVMSLTQWTVASYLLLQKRSEDYVRDFANSNTWGQKLRKIILGYKEWHEFHFKQCPIFKIRFKIFKFTKKSYNER
jgi:hypothetical protein